MILTSFMCNFVVTPFVLAAWWRFKYVVAESPVLPLGPVFAAKRPRLDNGYWREMGGEITGVGVFLYGECGCICRFYRNQGR